MKQRVQESACLFSDFELHSQDSRDCYGFLAESQPALGVEHLYHTYQSILSPKKHTMIFLFSLLPFVSIQKHERKRMVMSAIAVGVQVAKPSTVRRANIWEKK